MGLLTLALIAATGGAFVESRLENYFMISGMCILAVGVVAALSLRPFNFIRLAVAVGLVTGPLALTILLHNEPASGFLVPTGVAALGVFSYLAARQIKRNDWKFLSEIVPPVGLVLFGLGLFTSHISFSQLLHMGEERASVGAMQPTQVGSVAVALLMIAAVSVRRTYFGVMFACCAGICLLANARGALLGTIGIFLVWLFLELQRGGKLHLRVFILLFAVAMALLIWPLLEPIVTLVFQADNSYRGANSGFSGRTAFWEFYLDLWRQEPIFGIGTLPAFTGGLRAHNIFIQILATTGLFGIVMFLSAILWVCWPRRKDTGPCIEARRLGIFAVVGYLVDGLFDTRAINIANSISMIFFFAVFSSLGQGDTMRSLKVRAAQTLRFKTTRMATH
jgi:O-antigen ligase